MQEQMRHLRHPTSRRRPSPRPREPNSALARRNRLLEGMFMATKMGMVLVDERGSLVMVNHAMSEMLGYTRAQLEGRSLLDITHPDDRALSRASFETVRGDPQRTVELEKRYVARNGRVILVALTASSFLESATGPRYHVMQVKDITSSKRAEQALLESEERWRMLLARVGEIVVLVDGAGLISYVSPSVKQWLGYEPDEVIGRDVRAGTHRDDLAELTRVLETATPDAPVTINQRVRALDGSWRSLESTIVGFRDDPVVGALLIVCRDVTERVALEQERERLELDRRVSQRLEAVGQLASGIAHEINTPLQFVGDSITFLKDAVDDLLALSDQYRETLYTDAPIPVEERRVSMRAAEERADLEYLCERIPAAFVRTADGIDRVRSIVQAMKRFSHDSGSERAPADLNDALETTLAVCRNEYKYVADLDLDFGVLPPVACNIAELNQVFLNLILNASQAIAEKVRDSGERGQIRISTRFDGAEVMVEIADDGPGIPPELQDRIYEPFFTTKEVGKGTGQGLALARNTIQRQSGVLECHSELGAGATFTIRLPASQDSQPLTEAA
jgi:PAS domain S-box-containing protein